MRRFLQRRNASDSGVRDVRPDTCSCRKAGDSSSLSLIQIEMMSSPSETRNGTRQPQSAKASSPRTVRKIRMMLSARNRPTVAATWIHPVAAPRFLLRSEEHTSELQSHHDLVCRLL